jgi:hypothetical protein
LSGSQGTIVSKEDGALWGLANFPEEYREIIRLALDVYRASTRVTTENRRTGGIEWDAEKLFAFRDFVVAKCNYSARGDARIG